jgi:hypothetical protein
VVLDRRLRDILRVVLSGVIPALLALAITLSLPSRDLPLVLGGIMVILVILGLMVSSRLEVTVALLAVYLGMFNGPIKLLLGNHELTGAILNVLILAVALGAVMRMIARREPVRLPPLSAWVVAFFAIVMIEAFNPHTHGLLHVIGGFRQQLQFLPFFFFGYAVMRSKKRFRQLFLIVGVVALAGGIVSTYQTGLSPAQLAAWGPGYHTLIYPAAGGGRTFSSEGEARVRPPGLGSEAGASGGLGVLALPFGLALLATSRWRRRWIAVLLCLGALVALVTGLGRLQLIGAGLAVIVFAALAAAAGQRATRTIGALLAIIVLAVPSGLLLASLLRKGTFNRYETIGTSTSTTLHKESALALVPRYLEAAPFGFGLGIVGSVASLGGKETNQLEGHGVSAETQYNFIVTELGAPGLIVWVGVSVYVMGLVALGMRRVRDGDLAFCLAGAFAPFFALFVEGSSGPISDSAAAGPYFWFAIGTAAFWFAGPGRRSRLMQPLRSFGAPTLPAKTTS